MKSSRAIALRIRKVKKSVTLLSRNLELQAAKLDALVERLAEVKEEEDRLGIKPKRKGKPGRPRKKRPVGRPPKKKTRKVAAAPLVKAAKPGRPTKASKATQQPSVAPKRRGRPPKVQVVVKKSVAAKKVSKKPLKKAKVAPVVTAPKRRGRPPKGS